MASGIPTRRNAKRADENAPPAPTRSKSTIVTATSAVLAAKSTKSAAAENKEVVSKSSNIPIIKRSESSKTITKSRSALHEVTNAGKPKSASNAEKGKGKVERKPFATTSVVQQGSATGMRRTRSSVTETRSRQGTAEKEKEKAAPKRKLTAPAATSRPSASRSRSTTVSTSTTSVPEPRPLNERTLNIKREKEKEEEPTAKRRRTSTPPVVDDAEEEADLADEAQYDEDGKEILLSSGGRAIGLRSPKRVRAKDEGWEDLDAEDEGDPTMVSEYVVDAFRYMMALEKTTLPDPNYMDAQGELQWQMRTILNDWLIEVHAKFRLLPETLFIASNLIDRFLSARVISLIKFQLVGLTALFIAAKYEEVICPSITHFLHMADGGYGVEEILKAERYMLSTLEFDMSYPNPLHFLRRISKADGYDIQARTVGKFLIEISCLEHRLMRYPPSLLAAAAMWLARFCLERGDWNANLVHYSTYSEEELVEPAQLMLDFLLAKDFDKTTAVTSFYKKYAGKKHMKASVFMRQWAIARWPETPGSDRGDEGVELYLELGLEEPERATPQSRSSSVAAL